MKFIQFSKKNVPLITTQYYSLLWDQNDDKVKFDAFIDIIEEHGCKIVSMTYRKPNQMVDNRCMMIFGVRGTFGNLDLFEQATYHNPKLKQFMDTSLDI